MRIERVPRAVSGGVDATQGRVRRPAAGARVVGESASASAQPGSARSASLSHLSDYRRESGGTRVPKPGLSVREVEVLLTWLGAESKEHAAEQLFISASTVSTHLARIRAKYAAVGREAPTKTHLFARALQDGYTSLDRW